MESFMVVVVVVVVVTTRDLLELWVGRRNSGEAKRRRRIVFVSAHEKGVSLRVKRGRRGSQS
jgi:hypothetical protein